MLSAVGSPLARRCWSLRAEAPAHHFPMSSWQGKAIRVRARLVPRLLWTTASIDVFLEEQCVLRTGGQFKVTGSHAAKFDDGNSEHQAVLAWGRVRDGRFPYRLQIDGAQVEEAEVGVENRLMGFIPSLCVIAIMVSIAVLASRGHD